MEEPLKQHDLIGIDLSKIASLHQKRTLAFVNHFVITTVQFLNNFMKQCDHKLMMFERKLAKVEASLVLLETRLQSIPEGNLPSEVKPTEIQVAEVGVKCDEKEEPSPCEESKNETDCLKVAPEYERFVKMFQVGVPLDAVKLKVSLEGLDPNILDKYLR